MAGLTLAAASPVPLELEPPTRVGLHPLPAGDVQASLWEEALARWNIGGKGDPDYPSSRPRFHPAARVVVDAKIVGAWHRQGTPEAVRRKVEARARTVGYWPFRVCYEAALRRDPEMTVDYRVRMTAAQTGRVSAVRGLESLTDSELAACLQRAALTLGLGTLPARRIDADLRIRLWPGDAPLPARSEPPLAAPPPVPPSAEERWSAARAELTRCAMEGLSRDGKLWGRLALLVEFGATGEVTQAKEYESRFPDPEVTACATRVVRGLHIPGATEPLVFALRLGTPPEAPPK